MGNESYSIFAFFEIQFIFDFILNTSPLSDNAKE